MRKKEINQERVENNLEVLKLLANKNSKISPEAKREILNKYKGWSGLREAIYTPSICKKLKKYLSDTKIESIKQSTNSAYYTPELLIKFIWSILSRLGFKGGDILEQAAGIGSFLDHIPTNIKDNSEIDAVEMDLLTINPPIKHPTYLLQIASDCNIIFRCQKKKILGNYQ